MNLGLQVKCFSNKKQEQMKKLILLLVIIFLGETSWATDGYFGVAYGTKSKGLAGAGTGYWGTSLINGNPAGLSFLTNEMHFGLALFNPNRKYTVTGNPSGMPGTFGLMPGTVESDSKYFLIPSFGINQMVTEKSAVSISIFGNGGMNTDYGTNTLHDPQSQTTGVNLMQLFSNISYSYKIAENHSIGVTGVLAFQQFEAKGLRALSAFSNSPDNLTNKGKDNSFGVGFKVGYMGNISESFSVGISYQSKVFMSEFEDYAGLFAEEGDFDIPASWSVGVAYKANEKWTILADFKQIFYSNVKSVGNKMLPNIMQSKLGTSSGAGFGWKDISVVKLGLEYQVNNDWTLRGGVSVGQNPIPKTEVLFNILAPGVIESHLALGSSIRVGKGDNMLHFAFNYALNNKVEGQNLLDPGANQKIALEMNQLEFEIAFSF